PSRVTPSAWNLKRASRTGPLDCTKNGGVLCAPAAVAMATSGLIAGLVPPVAGCAWHPPHESRLKRAPSPSGTVSCSSKSAFPSLKNSSWPAVRPASGAPAPAAPPRTPGSWAGGGSCADSVAVWMLTTHMNANSTGADMNRDFFQIIDPPLDRRYASAAGGDMHHRRDGG